MTVPEVVPFIFKAPVDPEAPSVRAPVELNCAFVKLIISVPAVVPFNTVSQPVPMLIADDVIVAPGSVRFPKAIPLVGLQKHFLIQ